MTGRPRLLVVRISSLGDVVLATSVLASLRESRPDAHLAVLTRPQFRPLFEHHPCLDELFEAPAEARSFADWFHHGLGLRRHRFDALVDLQYNWRTLALSLALAPVRVRRWDRAHGARRRLLARPGRRTPSGSVPHMVERFHRATRPWTKDRVHPPHVAADRATWERAAELLRGHAPADASWLAAVPVAHWATKRWPAERWAELCARWTAGPNRHALAFFGPADGEVRRAFERAGGGGGRTHAVTLDLGTAGEVLRRMDVVVTGDTGLMHLATAVEAPVVALYGSTSPAFGVGPYGPKHRVLSLDLPCRPCTLHGAEACPLGHFRCMRDLTVDRAWSAIEATLNGRPTAAASP